MTRRDSTFKRQRRALLGAAVALIVFGFVGCGVVAFRTAFGVSAQDKARTKLLAEESILGARPEGFLRRGTSSNPGSPQIFFGGGASDNQASATDTIVIPSITAAGQLLRMAQADGWAVLSESCHPDDDRYSLSATKRIGGFIARLSVEAAGDGIDGYPFEPQTSVEVSAPHHKYDNEVTPRTAAAPGCLAAVTPASVPDLRDELPDGTATNLERFDLATGNRLWSVACDPDSDRTVFAYGTRTLTSCDSFMQVRDERGKVTCVPDEKDLRRYGSEVVPIRNPDLFITFGVDPTNAFDLSCQKRWNSAKDKFTFERLRSVGDGFLLSARTVDNKDTLLRLDQGSGRTLWMVDGAGSALPAGDLLVTRVVSRLTGLDPSTGRAVWQHPDFESGAVRATGADFFVTAGDELFAVFDAVAGSKRLQQPAPDQLVSMHVVGDRLFIRTPTTVVVMSSTDGREFATIPIPPTAQVRVTTAGVALLDAGTLHWYDGAGRETWSATVAGLSRTVVVDATSRTVVVVDGTNKLIARDTRTGKVRWSKNVDGVGVAPVISGEGVFVRTKEVS